MPAYVVLGAQYGDEGKGKIIDYLANDIRPVSGSKKKSPVPADVVVRFNGGNNAGHTVHNPLGKFALHLIPAGIFSPTTLNIIGPQVAVDPKSFYNEDPDNPGEFQSIQKASGLHIEDLYERLRISKKAHIIMPWHIFEDALQEEARGGKGLGTTKRGIGPMYTDKAARVGIRVCDVLLNNRNLYGRFNDLWGRKRSLFSGVYGVKQSDIEKAMGNPDDIFRRLLEFAEIFEPCFADVERLIQDAERRGAQILFEGAQGFLLDIDHGTYPYVTSSNIATSMYSCGVSRFKEIIGVVKAYTTRIGTGPFPTEIFEDWEKDFREAAHEFGATTGRPRRIGWLDLPALKYFVAMSGATKLALTRLDTLADMPELKVGVGYDCLSHGLGCELFECVIDGLVPFSQYVYINITLGVPRFSADSFNDMPPKVKAYCDMIAREAAPIRLISYGPDREQTIVV